MQVTLRVTEGPHAGKHFSFQGHDMFMVGRSRHAHLRLPAKDRYMSRIHFLIEINPPYCRLMDMRSRGGTTVNGQRVDDADLKDGDVIKAGRTVFQVQVAAHDPATAAAPEVDDSQPLEASLQTLAPTSPASRGKPSDNEGAAMLPTLSFAPPPSGAPASLASVSASLPQTVPGYRLLRELGRGSMGIVYLASRNTDGTLVAVKTIIPAIDANPAEVKRFLREANILRDLDHPNIVRFLQVNASGGQLWFAMTYVAGTDAAQLLKKQGPLDVPRAVSLVYQLLQALEYAHARGFVHRDIKPANLLVTQRDGTEVALLTDFGLARIYQASQLSGLTMTGALGGTPFFMPPEQITDYRNTRPAADQYAAGMTLYNLLTNHCGFDMPRKSQQWVQMVLEDEPVPIRKRRPDLSEELSAVVHRALDKDQARRFSDVRAMRWALKGFLR